MVINRLNFIQKVLKQFIWNIKYLKYVCKCMFNKNDWLFTQKSLNLFILLLIKFFKSFYPINIKSISINFSNKYG